MKKNAFSKIIDIIKNNRMIFIVASVVLVAAIIIIAVSSSNSGSESDFAKKAKKEIVTANYLSDPEYDIGEHYVTVYFSDVTSESAENYVELLEDSYDTEFSNEKYPRVAVLDDKILTVHYNVTEMKMSLTITEKGNYEK